MGKNEFIVRAIILKKNFCKTNYIQKKKHDFPLCLGIHQELRFVAEWLVWNFSEDYINWMKEKEILDRYIWPLLGLNDEITITDTKSKVKKSTRYKGRPVGDWSELMSLNNSFFRYLRTSDEQHVGITRMLPLDDKQRFNKASPKLIMETINRIWVPDNSVSPRSELFWTWKDLKKHSNCYWSWWGYNHWFCQ